MTQSRRRISAVGLLIALNCGVFLYQLLRPDFNETLLDLYGLSSEGVEQGAWWQLVTHAFLHGNIWHLLFNMAGLWFAGRIVERIMGTGRFLALYIACAVAGGLAQLLLEGGRSLLLGASGAVCGVILAFATIFPEAQIVMLLFFVIPLRLRAKYLALGSHGIIVVVFSCRVRAVDWPCGALGRLCRGISSCSSEWLWASEFTGAADQENLALLEGDVISECRSHSTRRGVTESNRNARCR